MQFDILTIFPNLFSTPLHEGIIRRAMQAGKIKVNLHNIRDWTTDKHSMTDDRPFGGGEGMVMKPEPLAACLKDVQRMKKARVVLLSPRGKVLTQGKVAQLAKGDNLILVCGRYEGVDERFCSRYVDEEISIGDYILTGGELAAMVIVDSVTRMLPGVLGCADSAANDTFSRGLLKHGQYTRPREFEGIGVPEVLLSGDHAKVEEYRFLESVRETLSRRPSLLGTVDFTTEEVKQLKKPDCLKTYNKLCQCMQAEYRLDVALIHYPVVNRNDEIIGSAVTNLDLHDIARASRTYGVNTYWVVTPDARQQELATRIVEHWTEGYGGTVNPDRASALSLIRISTDIEEVVQNIEQLKGERPLLIATSAVANEKCITYAGLQRKLELGAAAVILFGTASGLAPAIKETVDYFLAPLNGAGSYNHLSVRSAVSITLDRLNGS